jgi:hypothetical protein
VVAETGLTLEMVLLVLQTLAAVVEVLIKVLLAVQVVQALSFFATPAQFNILLVAQ